MFTQRDFWNNIDYHNGLEKGLQHIFHIETLIGLYWIPSVRDMFRHMWE